ncbi:MAG: chaperone modulator CbpM [Kiloniellales bacterium]
MLATFEQVLVEIEVESADLTAWVEQNWVLPVVEDGRFLFDTADVARVRLIAELSRDMGVNEEAMPIVLRLLDQIYSLRRALSDLNQAIKALPEAARDQLEADLRRRSAKSDSAESDSANSDSEG